MLRSALALAAALLLAGCLGLADSVMKPWMGASDAALMSAWGAPDIETKTAGGARVVTYRSRGDRGNVVCSKTFMIDRAGYVIAWSHNCPL
jgi:hypothetical protein